MTSVIEVPVLMGTVLITKGRRCHRKCSDFNIALVRGPIPSSLGMAGGLGGRMPFLMMLMVVNPGGLC